MEKTHWKKAFNSDYLSSCDIEERDLILTIEYVKLEEVTGQNGKQNRNVAHFKEKVKPMILNVTNSKQVKKFAGSRYIEDWVNIPVQIYVDTKVRMMGEDVEGLRIRSQQPKVGKPELLPDTEQWKKAIGFLLESGELEKITKKYIITENNLTKLNQEVADAKALQG
jgi:hypothetical protein